MENITDKNEIILSDFLAFAWSRKRKIAYSTIVFAILAVLYALSLPNLYKSELLLAPSSVENDNELNLARFNPFANLTGAAFGSSNPKALEAISKLETLDFFEEEFFPKIKVQDIMAVDYWDMKTDKIIYDSNLYLSEKNEWVRTVQFPRKKVPSAQEAYEIFNQRFYSVSHDEITNYVTISVLHYSPTIAEEWGEIIFDSINKIFREEERERAQKAINYLDLKLKQTSLAELKQVFSELIKIETNKLMLVESNQDYVFKTVQPSFRPEIKDQPSRALICIFGTFMGFMLTLAFYFGLYARKIFFNN